MHLDTIGPASVSRDVRRRDDMTTKHLVIRLLAAVAALLLSCSFVSVYNVAGSLSYERGRSLPAITASVVRWAPYTYALPVALLLIGVAFLRSRRDRYVGIECIVSVGWLGALAWVLIAVFAWQLTHIELYSGPH